eukprot:gene2318-1454_t
MARGLGSASLRAEDAWISVQRSRRQVYNVVRKGRRIRFGLEIGSPVSSVEEQKEFTERKEEPKRLVFSKWLYLSSRVDSLPTYPREDSLPTYPREDSFGSNVSFYFYQVLDEIGKSKITT